MKKIKDKKCLYCPCKNVWQIAVDKEYTTYECGACYQQWKESKAPEQSLTDLIEQGHRRKRS
jgi:hypothetical protein